MLDVMRLLSAAPILLALAVPVIAEDRGDKDHQAIRKKIPSASAMNRKAFEAWATGTAIPSLHTVEDRSLTAHLFTMKMSANESMAKRREFRFLGNITPRLSELADEVGRYRRLFGKSFPSGPITFIHEDRITEFACKIDDGQARGHVVFEAPARFAGRVNFTASRMADVWQITSFSMPARGLKIVADEKQVWKPVETTNSPETIRPPR